EYLTWELKERVELIRGYIFKMVPAPSSEHQRISMYIGSAMHQFLKSKPCEVFTAPFDVRFYDPDDSQKAITNVVQPDISVICDLSKVDTRGCLGAPDLIVEVLSPSTSE